MVLKLDPRYPLVWRTPTAVQIGVDPSLVVLERVSNLQERMLAALVVGVSEPGLTMIADGATGDRDALLAALAPVLVGADGAAIVPTVAVSGSDELVTAITTALRGSGLSVVPAQGGGELADIRPDLAVVADHFVLPPDMHAFWLRRDVPHLPVVIGDAAVTVGPFVEPGDGPCLLCLELHRRDADGSWPAIAAQLLGRRSRAESAVLLAETAAIVGRAVLVRLAGGPGEPVSTRVDAVSGSRSQQRWRTHPECGCRGVDALLSPDPISPGQPGTGWADAARRAPVGSTPS